MSGLVQGPQFLQPRVWACCTPFKSLPPWLKALCIGSNTQHFQGWHPSYQQLSAWMSRPNRSPTFHHSAIPSKDLMSGTWLLLLVSKYYTADWECLRPIEKRVVEVILMNKPHGIALEAIRDKLLGAGFASVLRENIPASNLAQWPSTLTSELMIDDINEIKTHIYSSILSSQWHFCAQLTKS